MDRFDEHFGVVAGDALSGSDGSSSFDCCDVARFAGPGAPAARSCAWASSVAFAEPFPFSLDGGREGMVSRMFVAKRNYERKWLL